MSDLTNESRNTGSGFSTHIQQQLNDAASQVSRSSAISSNSANSGRSRGRGLGRGHRAAYSNDQAYRGSTNSRPQHNNFPDWNGTSPGDRHDEVEYPALGSRPAARQRNTIHNNAAAAQNFFARDRAGRGGRGSFHQGGPGNRGGRGSHEVVGPLRRDQSQHGPAYQHASDAASNQGSDQSNFQQQRESASTVHASRYPMSRQPVNSSIGLYDSVRGTPMNWQNAHQYLDRLAAQVNTGLVDSTELEKSERFRIKLEKIVRTMISEYAKENVTINAKSLRLVCYGSMANGFAVKGSDMDLMVMLSKDQLSIGELETELPRMIEKTFLDEGIGARMLEHTRVPILKVASAPRSKLLQNLRDYRAEWEEEQELESLSLPHSSKSASIAPLPPWSAYEDLAMREKFEQLSFAAAETPLPSSPSKEERNKEFSNEDGIRCDINFTNYVAVYNTQLLRCYCKCDARVRQMGLFVKMWAKARKINTPYYGTLSSYGYTLMVLHFLMNVATPPVIPNLQHLKKDNDDWLNVKPELFEGLDIRFMNDERRIEHEAATGGMTNNRESLGALLRRFFWYYSDAKNGFDWKYDVVSIRTKGGVISKQSKKWTYAKHDEDNKQIRQRYLVAIEDPFEIEHNVGRVVGHHGIVAIRDEFRRAYNMLRDIQPVPGQPDQWRRRDGGPVEDLMAEANERGDLLRKDQEYGRLRKQAEAEARGTPGVVSTRNTVNLDNKATDEELVSGTFYKSWLTRDGPKPEPPLTRNDAQLPQEQKFIRTYNGRNARQPRRDSESSSDAVQLVAGRVVSHGHVQAEPPSEGLPNGFETPDKQPDAPTSSQTGDMTVTRSSVIENDVPKEHDLNCASWVRERRLAYFNSYFNGKSECAAVRSEGPEPKLAEASSIGVIVRSPPPQAGPNVQDLMNEAFRSPPALKPTKPSIAEMTPNPLAPPSDDVLLPRPNPNVHSTTSSLPAHPLRPKQASTITTNTTQASSPSKPVKQKRKKFTAAEKRERAALRAEKEAVREQQLAQAKHRALATRDQEPNTIPIPQGNAFAFDPRQLEELARLQSGNTGYVPRHKEKRRERNSSHVTHHRTGEPLTKTLDTSDEEIIEF